MQRGAARQKLQQIEDLFEARWTAAVAISAASASRLAASSSSAAAVSTLEVEDSADAATPICPLEEHPQSLRALASEMLASWFVSNNSKAFMVLRRCAPVTQLPIPPVVPVTGPQPTASSVTPAITAAGVSTYTTDLVTAAARYTAALAALPATTYTVSSSSSSSIPIVSSVVSVIDPSALGVPAAVETTLADWGVWSSREDATTVMAAQEFGWPSGERRVLRWEIFFRQGVDKSSAPFHRSVFNGKVFLRRIKEIATVLRIPLEASKPVEVVAPILKVRAKVAVKLNSLVLKALQRWGYPRKLYEELRVIIAEDTAEDGEAGDEGVSRQSYLLTWPTFAAHCGFKEGAEDPEGPGVSVGAVEEIVTAMVGVKGTSSGADAVAIAGEGAVEGEAGGEAVEGLLVGLNLRVIEASVEKADLLHKLRMTLACHTDKELLQCFKVSEMFPSRSYVLRVFSHKGTSGVTLTLYVNFLANIIRLALAYMPFICSVVLRGIAREPVLPYQPAGGTCRCPPGKRFRVIDFNICASLSFLCHF